MKRRGGTEDDQAKENIGTGSVRITIPRDRVADLYRDKVFYRDLFQFAMPLILQNFIASSLSMVGGLMIGQLGDATVAAFGLCNQVFFLLTLLLFGINSGAAIFIAQMWGKRDIANIRRVLGLSLGLSLAGGAIFAGISILAPGWVLRIYSTDPQVIAIGSGFLRIFGLSFIFTAITFSYSSALRSTGNVRTPLLVSMTALSLNVVLSFVLIFGKLGLPALGIQGAALAILITRILECIALVWIVYWLKAPAAASLREMTDVDRIFAVNILRWVLPVTFNEILWSLGMTTYNVIYAHIGTDSIAAMNISMTIDNLAFVFFIGTANACAILVGNAIGTEDEEKAQRYAGQTLALGVAVAVLIGAAILLVSGPILSLYKVSPLVIAYSQRILAVVAGTLWLRVTNLILFIGILRSGGDTRYAFLVDVGAIWLIGVPLAFIGAFVLDLPVYLVYLLVMTEELIKGVLCLQRFFSKKWINNLAITVQ